MNVTLLNTINLDDGTFIKKGGGGTKLNNQEKTIDISENGTTTVVPDKDFTGLSKVTVNTNVSINAVVFFYDYEGTLLFSYSRDEFLALIEMPPLPSREGLICEGWNWDLDEAQEFISEYDTELIIGATYITDNNETRIYISLTLATGLTIALTTGYISENGNMKYIIDWGDGSVDSYSNAYQDISHTYEHYGKYVIKMNCENNSMPHRWWTSIVKNSKSALAVCKIHYGLVEDVRMGSYYFPNLEEISLSAGALANQYSSVSTPINKCRCLIVPKGASITESPMFYSDTTVSSGVTYNQSQLLIVSYPKHITTINISSGISPYSTHGLPHIIPPYMTLKDRYIGHRNGYVDCRTTNIEGAAFTDPAITSISLPTGLTTIPKNCFSGCSCASLDIPQTVNVIGESAFSRCLRLTSLCIPDGVDTIPSYCFQGCVSLRNLDLPDTVTTIQTYAFYETKLLTYLKMPKNVNSLKSYALDRMGSIPNRIALDFSESQSIPTIESNTIYSSYTPYTIIVPDSLYEEWTIATNWSKLASNIIKKSDWDAQNA